MTMQFPTSLLSYRFLTKALILIASAPLLAVHANEAFAHHPMGGEMVQTFAQGLLSGLGHPVIGLDHLMFIIAVGIAAAFVKKGILLPIVFIIATMVGVAVHMNAIDLPFAEMIVIVSLITAGLLLAFAIQISREAWALLFAFAGIFHGFAYAESIIGAEQSPLIAYLIGLTAIQTIIAVSAMALTRTANIKTLANAHQARIAAGCILGVGLTLLAGIAA